MATKNSESKVKQKAILEQEQEKKASESVLIETKLTSEKKKTITKSRRRTSLEEFALVKNMRPEIKAGFKVWLNGQYFHFDSEWEELYKQYQNR